LDGGEEELPKLPPPPPPLLFKARLLLFWFPFAAKIFLALSSSTVLLIDTLASVASA